MYKPFRPFGRGITPARGFTNHCYEALTTWDDPLSSWWLYYSLGLLSCENKTQHVFGDRNPFRHGNPRVPPQCQPPPRNKALLIDYEPPSSPNKALLRPYFLGGGGFGGVPLDFHDSGEKPRPRMPGRPP